MTEVPPAEQGVGCNTALCILHMQSKQCASFVATLPEGAAAGRDQCREHHTAEGSHATEGREAGLVTWQRRLHSRVTAASA